MKVSSINNINNYKAVRNVSFKNTAVPYPEFKSAYEKQTQNSDFILALTDKIAKLFSPEVRKEAANIKGSIDAAYDVKTQKPKKALLTVLA